MNTHPTTPQILSVEKIWDRSPHNAFTDLVRFADRWWCTFREAQDHGPSIGTVRVICSDDGHAWESAAVLAEQEDRPARSQAVNHQRRTPDAGRRRQPVRGHRVRHPLAAYCLFRRRLHLDYAAESAGGRPLAVARHLARGDRLQRIEAGRGLPSAPRDSSTPVPTASTGSGSPSSSYPTTLGRPARPRCALCRRDHDCL